MRLALLALVLAAATTAREGCGNGSSSSTPPAYDPCAGQACGASCRVCPPDAKDCVETADVKACDPSGRCVPMVDGLCATGECAGKACGAPCEWPDLPCLHATPPCLPPVGPGYCDGSGACVQGYPPPAGSCPPAAVTSCAGQACGVRCEMPCPAGTACDPNLPNGWCAGDQCLSAPPPCPPGPPPSWGCAGKACGDSCGYCPPGQDPATCPVPTFAATACDAQLQCVTAVTVTCSPAAACQGKACGAACETCPGCMRPYAMSCDASGACVAGSATCGP